MIVNDISYTNKISNNMLKLPSPTKVMEEVQSTGFAIVHNAVALDFIEKQRNRWLPEFKRSNVTKKFVRGNLILGEPDFLSYSNIPEWCLYRNFEFLWNESIDIDAIQLHTDLHGFRNTMQDFKHNFGLTYNSKNYGFYISTSYYPINEGRLGAHTDGHGNFPILHYMLPLTFKGKDYFDGGLWCKDRNGIDHNIDDLVLPGSIIFFDGRQKHWVEKIIGNESLNVGRLAVFAIPTFFKKDAKISLFKRSSYVFVLELANKLGIIKLS